MPIASPEKYAEMLDAAKAGSYAFPAINITSSQTLNAALQGFAEAGMAKRIVEACEQLRS
ncbi:MAG: class II fructose-bisphosphate aldolase, partial [Propionicimonas sp.]|nr:class II fructose-bisphosphate aldolase [Propionicimonas sp.]